jgi:NTE family protein
MIRRLYISLFLLLILTCLYPTKIGFAFSGGGARGFAHIGMLKVLEEAGIKPDYISGTSIGALIGALYSMGYNASEIESLIVKSNWDDIFNDDYRREDLFIGQKRWAPFGNAVFRLDENWAPRLPQAVIIGNRINLELFRLFEPASKITDFNKLQVPFAAIATNLLSGRQMIFRSGSLMQAVRASMSIPSILQPFPLNDSLYIDGGLSQNLPGKQVKDMGADFVIGFKVNSTLQPEDKLHDLIKVLDQTINIGITNRLNEQTSFCNFILEPDLEGFSATKFKNAQLLIKAGEDYARQHYDELIKLASVLSDSTVSTLQINTGQVISTRKYSFDRIQVEGNKYLSASMIRDYTGLHSALQYDVNHIIKGVKQAWNSQLFDIIYPVIETDGVNENLKLIITERERKHVILNFSYDRDNEFVASVVLSLQNYLMKNSSLLSEIKLGGKNELNLDFVKNFGQAYGIYYRLFPYLNEKRIYFYNDNHDKITSARSMEYGLTAGLGFFARKSIVLEGFIFSSSTKLYREVALSDTLEKTVSLSGVGLKLYHESLDDYVFPTRGAQACARLSFANDKYLSDQTINKLNLCYKVCNPISGKISGLLGLRFGSHFKQNNLSNFDPFYLGGLDNFAPYQLYEKSAPFFEMVEAGLIYKADKHIRFSSKVQALNFAKNDILIPEQSFMLGGVIEAGYQTYLGPVRIAVAFSEETRMQYYIALGYTGDLFHFSRR